MILGVVIVMLALCVVIGLSTQPRKAFVALPAAVLAMVVLIEEAGVAPRLAVIAGLLISLALSVSWRSAGVAKAPQPSPADRAWDRLAGSAGFLARGRVAAVRRRRELLVSRGDDIDPFSSFGELRLKLERRVPELIENYLDEAATAPKLRRHLLMSELLGEIEGLVARAEAVDPTAIARADRRTALRAHLGRGADRGGGE
ncbi:hypothetical protein M9980_14035 [Sphingomonas donggukensis]|uniref:Uncharacterized protein n=1 Tax=Sphingomonas donggukensis TaxID=2949093 RepID=A0ABY4TT88_9SPHN|nr:hypothetical protein [Sphingomonas donggukensis]URW75620.1 hypothetical protein M9980_14035 [Sphingomonas donggukensis]